MDIQGFGDLLKKKKDEEKKENIEGKNLLELPKENASDQQFPNTQSENPGKVSQNQLPENLENL